MQQIINFLSSTTNTILTIGYYLVVLACAYKSIATGMNGDAKGSIQVIIGYIISFVIFMLIPTIFAAIKGAIH